MTSRDAESGADPNLPETQQGTRKVFPRNAVSAPAFASTGRKTAIKSDSAQSHAECSFGSNNRRPKTALVYRVSRIPGLTESADSEVFLDCRSRTSPRKQRRVEEVCALEARIIVEHTLATSGLTPAQDRLLAHRLDSTRILRRVFSSTARGTRTISPAPDPRPRTAGGFPNVLPQTSAAEFPRHLARKSGRRFAGAVTAGDNEDIFEFAEEFRCADGFGVEDDDNSARFPVIAEEIACEANDCNNSDLGSVGASTLSSESSWGSGDGQFTFPIIKPQLHKIADESSELAAPLLERVSQREESGIRDRKQSSCLSLFNNGKLVRNSLYSPEQEMQHTSEDMKSKYSSLVNPGLVHDSYLNLRSDVKSEDAVAETEMKIVLRDLQSWAQQKYASLFQENLEIPRKFLGSFERPGAPAALPLKVTTVFGQAAPASQTIQSPQSHRMSLSSSMAVAASVARSTIQQRLSTATEEQQLKDTAFEEFLLLTPWKPAFEDSSDQSSANNLTKKQDKKLQIKETDKKIPSMVNTNKVLGEKAKQLRKRLKYGTNWHLNPQEWESLIRDRDIVAHAALGFSQVPVNTNFEEDLGPPPSGAASSATSVEEKVGSTKIVVVVGGRNGRPSRGRVYERQTPGSHSDDGENDIWSFLRRSSSSLFACFDAVPDDDDDLDVVRRRNPSVFTSGNIVGFGSDNALDSRYPYPYPPQSMANPLLQQQSYPLPRSMQTIGRTSSLRGSSLMNSSIVGVIFRHLPPRHVQRVSRVCKLWRKCAEDEISNASAKLNITWIPSKTFPSGKWSGKLIIDHEYNVDSKGVVSVIQLRQWTFGSLLRSPFSEDETFASTYTVIPVKDIDEVSIEFPIAGISVPKAVVAKQSKSRTVAYSRSTSHFETSQQATSRDVSLANDVLFAENFCILFGSSGCDVELVRLGIAPFVNVVTNKGNRKKSYEISSRIRKSSTIYSQLRWMQLIKFESEVLKVLAPDEDAVASPSLQTCFDSCAMRNYLSCPEIDRTWAFKSVIATLLAPSPDDLMSGREVLASVCAGVAKIANKVDILLMLDIPFTQRMQRLNEYHVEAWRLWMRELAPAHRANTEEFEEIALAGDSSHGVSVIGGVALRVCGYEGSLKAYEAVYEFLQNVAVPALQ
ncbi:hypothetical protein HDU83_008255 [Entophlyctis luteolus]|nr:hypothetical protein HDU83_008255 [Entophlyctis luteolus]